MKTEVLSTSEVAEILGVNKQRMSKLISDKHIEAVKKKIGNTSLSLLARCGGVERIA
ncbi:helix-turn-helix domain-containing protein [Bacillus subtilis]|uniref:helix-turn-helix domain-containing protein n=1 Tax=Bacillus subtilis TaxID=1423 RepID=UPI00338E15A3